MEAPVWREAVPVSGVPTEAVGIKAATPPAAQLVIIPGNPGSATFYTFFMRQLHTAFGGAIDVTTISNLGHDPQLLTPGKVMA